MAGQRERARKAVLDDITAEARRQLARDGAAGLSLRSVARQLDMGSSGIYRYVNSRDELLTRLIVAGYQRLGEALERAGADVTAPRARWHSRCTALRRWAMVNPHEYALLYGSPVPGYAAPQDTIDPATRVYAALAEPLRDARPMSHPAVDGVLADDGARLAEALGLPLGPAQAIALLGGWGTLFGLVSLELFGHTHNVVTDHDAFFAHHVERLADQLGL